MEQNNQKQDTINTKIEKLIKSEEEIENKEQVIIPTLEDLLKEEKEKYIRLYAEFDNFKKRATKERFDLFKTAGKEILTSLLPILDDFERCTKEISKIEANDFTKGVELIQTKFIDILKSKGLQKQEVAIGEIFDVEKHEAITQITAPSEELKDKIIDVIEQGYLLADKPIRYAKVIIGK